MNPEHPEDETPSVSPDEKNEIVEDVTIVEETGEQPCSQADSENLLKRLPPKFLALDPDFIDHHIGDSSHRVLLPDGDGGVQSVDGNIVRIQHHGKTYELVALSPEKRKKRRRLINAASIICGVVFLLIFFWWLNR